MKADLSEVRQKTLTMVDVMYGAKPSPFGLQSNLSISLAAEAPPGG